MSLLLSILAAAAAAQGEQAERPSLSTDFVLGASTEELAKAVLPPEIAAKVKGHRLGRPHLHWIEGYPARFWGEVTAIAPGFCKRTTYYVPMGQKPKGTLTPGRTTEGAQVKMAADCASAAEPFISLNRTSPEEAVTLLRWLKDAHRNAGRTGELRLDLKCRSEQEPNPCEKGARQVLAELPVERVSIIGRASGLDRDEDWRISIQPPSDPELYWQLSIFEWKSDRPRLRMSWDRIPPF